MSLFKNPLVQSALTVVGVIVVLKLLTSFGVTQKVPVVGQYLTLQ